MTRKRLLRYALLVGSVALTGLGAAFAPVLSRLDYARLPTRASWQLPERVIEVLELRPGDVVADIGAGDGYFTFPLAEAVGPEGRVHAVDVDEDVLHEIRKRVDGHDYDNVEVALARVDDPGLPDGAIDLAFLCNVYHHIEDRRAYFDDLRRYLAPGGRVAVIDVQGRAPFRWLTPPGHELGTEVLLEEMEAAQYREVARFEFLPLQLFIVFSPVS